MKKSSFIVWWLVIELLIELLKAHLLLNKTKQKTIISSLFCVLNRVRDL